MIDSTRFDASPIIESGFSPFFIKVFYTDCFYHGYNALK